MKHRLRLKILAAATTVVLTAFVVYFVLLSGPSPRERAFNEVQPGMTEERVRQILGEHTAQFKQSITLSDGKRYLGDGLLWLSKEELVFVAFEDGVATEKGHEKNRFSLLGWLKAGLKRLGL
jgi:hypothetical protein